MDSIEKELIALVENKLPAAELGAVKNIITRLESAISDGTIKDHRIRSLEGTVESYSKTISDLQLEKSNWVNTENQKALNEARTKELDKKEHTMEVEKYKFEAQVRREALEMFLRNPVTRRLMQENIVMPSYDYNTGRPQTPYVNKQDKEEVTREE